MNTPQSRSQSHIVRASARVLASAGFLAAIAAAQGTTRVSVNSLGTESDNDSGAGTISADGRVVAFSSVADNLVPGDTNAKQDVFVHDRATGVTERVSVDSSGAQADGHSWIGGISADGKIVAFESYSTNLVAGDTNRHLDVFVHDRGTGITERVSVDSSGVEGNGVSGNPALSADGRIVAFESSSSNLVAADTNGVSDVFVHDRVTGVTERVSVRTSGVQVHDDSYSPSLSADGQRVAFGSFASDLAGYDNNNGLPDAFVHDRATGETVRASVDDAGVGGDQQTHAPVISADGRFVAFCSHADNLVAGDTNGLQDVFVRDLTANTTERVSVSSTGAQAIDQSGEEGLSISSDGSVVAFASYAQNLVDDDLNGDEDVFVRFRASGTTERISVDSWGGEADGYSSYPVVSADGTTVAFSSGAADLVAGDGNGYYDVFVHERCTVGAAWSNYGVGFAGTNGVPAFVARAEPILGTTLVLDLANSYDGFTYGLLFVGFQQTDVPTTRGGDLWVVPANVVVLGLAPGGGVVQGDLPKGEAACGVALELQALESDPGAAQGISFTQGLELLLGH